MHLIMQENSIKSFLKSNMKISPQQNLNINYIWFVVTLKKIWKWLYQNYFGNCLQRTGLTAISALFIYPCVLTIETQHWVSAYTHFQCPTSQVLLHSSNILCLWAHIAEPSGKPERLNLHQLPCNGNRRDSLFLSNAAVRRSLLVLSKDSGGMFVNMETELEKLS